MRIGIARIECQRPPVAVDGAVMAVEQVERSSQIVVGVRMGRVELQRVLEAAGGLTELPCGVPEPCRASYALPPI